MTLMFLRLIVSDSLTYYLSPEMHPYLYAATCILGLLSIVQLFAADDDETHGHHGDHHHALPTRGLSALVFYCLFLFPIISGFAFPDHTLGSDVAADRQIRRSALSAPSNEENNSGANAQPISHDQFDQLKNHVLSSRKIRIDPENYAYIMTIIEQNIDHLKGKQVELTGFVFRDQSVAANEIITARFVITCCIADASVYGMLTRGEVGHLKKDTWVRVAGRLNTSVSNEHVLPVLDVEQITPVSQPKNPYVYDNGIRLD
jgi:uncharacterized repeat protein (TIGR03943 family)